MRPTIHLYSRYLLEPEAISIKNNLKASGLDVEVNQLPFPGDITQSTILYSPLIKDREAINTVMTQLVLLGYRIDDKQPLVSGKHFYTKNNLGLFILPERDTAAKRIADIANLYESTHCDHDLSLLLNKDGTYALTSDEISYPESTEYLKGVWRITQYPYISLGPVRGHEWFYFEVKREQDVDRLGRINKIQLIQQDKYESLNFCDFVYGLRQ